MYVVLRSATLQSDVSFKNAHLMFEYKSALNKEKVKPRGCVFFLMVSDFHPLLSCQIMRLLKRMDSVVR